MGVFVSFAQILPGQSRNPPEVHRFACRRVAGVGMIAPLPVCRKMKAANVDTRKKYFLPREKFHYGDCLELFCDGLSCFDAPAIHCHGATDRRMAPIKATPALVDGVIYVRTDTDLYAFGRK